MNANPHKGLGCAKCHKKVPEKGKATRRDVFSGLVDNAVSLCRACHDKTDENHHPVRAAESQKVPEGLPLSDEGTLICSTCHDVHGTGRTAALLRGFETGRYLVRMDMCLDCHGTRFGEINPHTAGGEREKCYTCHPDRPVPREEGGEVVLQKNLSQVCNFCHNAAEKGHPANVDPSETLPRGLPRGREGDVMCGTCHDPHGTETTIHFLRPAYVEFLEKGRYTNPHGTADYGGCQGCHAIVSAKPDEMRKNVRYGGDDIQLCLSCHGAMDSCHPILVTPGKGADIAGLPLTADRRLKCTTCHDPMPSKGKGVGVRGRDAGDSPNAICFRCHQKTDLAGRNPHRSMDDRTTCKFCHDTMTDPTNDEAARVSFISNIRLICLRCHAMEEHPSGVNHMVTPRMSIPEPFRLDGKGKVTCTTCHNPHIDAMKEGAMTHRFVVEGEGGTLCRRCHRQ